MGVRQERLSDVSADLNAIRREGIVPYAQQEVASLLRSRLDTCTAASVIVGSDEPGNSEIGTHTKAVLRPTCHMSYRPREQTCWAGGTNIWDAHLRPLIQ